MTSKDSDPQENALTGYSSSCTSWRNRSNIIHGHSAIFNTVELGDVIYLLQNGNMDMDTIRTIENVYARNIVQKKTDLQIRTFTGTHTNTHRNT